LARAALLWPLLLVLPLLFGAAGALSAVQLEKPAAHRATAQVRNLLVSPPFVGGEHQNKHPTEHQSRFWGVDPLAREKNLVERVLRAANVSGLTEAEFLAHSRVAARSYSDLDFSVTSTSSATVIRLANIYASEYADSHTQQVRESIGEAIRTVRANIALLRRGGLRTAQERQAKQLSQTLPRRALRTAMERHAKQLSQTRRLEFSSVLQKASATTPVRKHALRNGIIGGLLGLILAIAPLLGLLRIFPALRPPRIPPIRTLLADADRKVLDMGGIRAACIASPEPSYTRSPNSRSAHSAQ
jgi:hypothetical protein